MALCIGLLACDSSQTPDQVGPRMILKLMFSPLCTAPSPTLGPPWVPPVGMEGTLPSAPSAGFSVAFTAWTHHHTAIAQKSSGLTFTPGPSSFLGRLPPGPDPLPAFSEPLGNLDLGVWACSPPSSPAWSQYPVAWRPWAGVAVLRSHTAPHPGPPGRPH